MQPPLAPKTPNGSLRVVIIGRISTPHQNEENIDASYRYVEDHLRKLHPGLLHITHLGERASGMLAERHTIRQAEDLIAAGRVDLVVAEDLSRIFRNPRHQLNFVQDAVDAGVRVLCLADNLDTASENWELMLGAAGLRHGLVVSDTRRRVRRTATHSFHGGGMVIKIPYGFRKLGSDEANSGQYGPKGLRIAKDQSCTPIIRQMRDWVLAGKPYSGIADWLNREGIGPGHYSKKGKWTSKLVIDLLRNPLLHGERIFRNITYVPILRTGKHRRERNPNPEREFHEGIAHLSVEEHEQLLRAMEARTANWQRRRGTEHPRYRVPRSKAIWPAQHLICGVCGGLMYCYNKGKLKCSRTFDSSSQCWNHIQVDADRVRRTFLAWLLTELESIPAVQESFLRSCWEQTQHSSTAAGRALGEAEREVALLTQQADRLAKAIGEGGELAALIGRLKEVQAAIGSAQARAETLRSQAAEQMEPVVHNDFSRDPFPVLLEQCRTSYEFAEVLKQLVSEAAVVPVQDLMHGQVRPRIKVKMTLARDSEIGSTESRTGTFDVFDRPLHIVYLARIQEIKRENPGASYQEIARALGVQRQNIKRSMRYLRLMEQHGVSDPYVELTAKPVQASRWRHRDDAA